MCSTSMITFLLSSASTPGNENDMTIVLGFKVAVGILKLSRLYAQNAFR